MKYTRIRIVIVPTVHVTDLVGDVCPVAIAINVVGEDGLNKAEDLHSPQLVLDNGKLDDPVAEHTSD